MQVEHSSVSLSTHRKGHQRTEPVWVGRYIVTGKDSRKDSEKVLGKAWMKRSRPAAGYLTEDAAKQVLENYLRELGARISAEEGVRFHEVAEDFINVLLRRIKNNDFRASTFRTYRAIIITQFIPRWGDRAMESITPEEIADYREERAAIGLSASSLNQHRAVIRGIWKVAKRYKLDPSVADAWQRAGTRGSTSGAMTFYTPEEVVQLIAHAESEQDAALFMTAAFTGLRGGELRAIRWRSIDFTNALIHVERGYTNPIEVNGETLGGEALPKSWKVRSMPLMPQVAEMLRKLRLRDHHTDDEDLVFPTFWGDYLSHDVMYRSFKRAQKEAGLKSIRFHDLRHSFGTMAIRVATIVDVQTWMGHADITTTRRYLHYAPQPQAAAALGSLIGENVAPVIPIRKMS